jgi:hypothetical protein
MRLLRWVVGALVILMLASCRVIWVIPKEGGTVKQSGGNWTCPAPGGGTCLSEVVDFYFDETFTAVPADGYKFKYWKKGGRRFCGGSNEPCRLTTTIFTGAWIPVIQPFLESSDEVFYLEPVFEKDSDVSSLECSLYAAGTSFCAEGPFPTCPITRSMGFQIAQDMSYEEVVNLVGCHGALKAYEPTGKGGWSVVYEWGSYNNPFLFVTVGFLTDSSETLRVFTTRITP